MTLEENYKRLKENNALLDENRLINGKKARDYYDELPFFKEKFRRMKEFLQKHPPPGYTAEDFK